MLSIKENLHKEKKHRQTTRPENMKSMFTGGFIHELTGQNSIKTTTTHVSNKNFNRIENPLDGLFDTPKNRNGP